MLRSLVGYEMGRRGSFSPPGFLSFRLLGLVCRNRPRGPCDAVPSLLRGGSMARITFELRGRGPFMLPCPPSAASGLRALATTSSTRRMGRGSPKARRLRDPNRLGAVLFQGVFLDLYFGL